MPDRLVQDLATDSVAPTNVVLKSSGQHAVVGAPKVTVTIEYAKGSEDNGFYAAPQPRYRVRIEEISP